ncbi:MAG: 3'-5' exonuclease [Spirochaetaceae bacterium]|nr:3'-5' exonuclease [Spirochaetaceae bacterium]
MSGPVFLALDFETTGLDASRERVVEIGAIRFRLESGSGGFDGRLIEEGSLASLVDPGIPMPSKARAVHGLGDEDLAGAPPFRDLARPLLSLAEGASIVAHNVSFDLSFLVSELGRMGLAAPRASALDTVSLSRKAFPGLPSYRLGSVAASLGIHPGMGHRAVDDARTCMRIYAACAAAIGRRLR